MAQQILRLSTILILSTVVFCDVPLDYSKREGLRGHGGAFAVLDWSDFELNRISSLHATGDYHEVMKMVKDKLVDAEISQHDRKRIESLLKKMRPPPLFKNLLDDEDTQRVRIAHGEGDVRTVLEVIDSRLRQLPSNLYEIALNYIGELSPKYDPEMDV